MNGRLLVCGREEREEFCGRGLTHMITVGNPGTENSPPDWFSGEHLPLWFGDVVSKADAAAYNTKAPEIDDVRRAILFFRTAWRQDVGRVMISCDYGASRSPALAYVCLADCFGVGREAEAFNAILRIRPDAVPNPLMIRIGDLLLRRDGGLMEPVKRMYADIAEQCRLEHGGGGG